MVAFFAALSTSSFSCFAICSCESSRQRDHGVKLGVSVLRGLRLVNARSIGSGPLDQTVVLVLPDLSAFVDVGRILLVR